LYGSGCFTVLSAPPYSATTELLQLLNSRAPKKK
jgi:hypothetical protein